jgi:glycosyltransferase involved in cell wall biosynthesis
VTKRLADAEPIRVAIDARIPHGRWGGVQQVVEGLASGIRELCGRDEYVFLTERGGADWLQPLLGGHSRVAEVPAGYGRTKPRRAYDAVADRFPEAARVASTAAAHLSRRAPALPRSNGYVERLGVDLVHFMTPQAFLTTLPSVYQPHDLLHRHHPEDFTRFQASYRDRAYRTFCTRAAICAVMTEFGRGDLVEAFDLPAQRVAVVPWAPVAGTGIMSRDTSRTAPLPADLPEQFVIYPAQTWPHKNHLRLIEALAMLRDRGTVIPLVCTGRQTEHFSLIHRRIRELRLANQVQFVGYLTPSALDALLARASALVFPSRFEGWGLPVVEAFSLGIPVACSDSSALPEVAGVAALMFDPDDTGAIADAIARIWQDTALRDDLRRRGRSRARELSWTRTARIFLSIHRLVAGRTLSDEDRGYLAPPTFPSPLKGPT